MKLCECGCGTPTWISDRTDPIKKWVKGVALRYVKGHNLRAGFKGQANPHWNGGRSRSAHGYITINTGDGRKRYEHYLVAERALGRPLRYISPGHPSNEVVHHINGVKTDNRNANLLICTHRYHTLLHVRLAASDAWPEFAKRDYTSRVAATRAAWADPVKRTARIEAIRRSKAK